MSSTTCPYCGVLTNFTIEYGGDLPRSVSVETALGSRSDVTYAAVRCQNAMCRRLAIGILVGARIERLWPEHVGGKAFPDVPDHIASAANEAYRCMSIKAFRAAVILGRAVLEATAKHQRIDETLSLMKKIDAMYEARMIRADVRDGAHEVRHFGNDMAHGDFIDPVTEDEVALVLTLMDDVLDEVFQGPARVKAAREAREAKRAQTQSP